MRMVTELDSVHPDGDIDFRPSSAAAVPRRAGVYVIYDLRGCLYVGRTANLYTRFHQHYDRSHNTGLRRALLGTFGRLRFCWIECDASRQEELEPALVRTLNPLHNVIRFTN